MLLKVKIRAWDRGLDMSQRAAEAPEGLEVLKVVGGGEAASLNSPETQEKTGRKDPSFR